MIKSNGYALPINKRLIEVLNQCISSTNTDNFNGIVLNFRDPNYSAESGGYHPVEVAIDKNGKIHYITDFAYFGLPPMVELEKELDFDFASGIFQQCGRVYPIEQSDELFAVWQVNFVDYIKADVFKVTLCTYM